MLDFRILEFGLDFGNLDFLEFLNLDFGHVDLGFRGFGILMYDVTVF